MVQMERRVLAAVAVAAVAVRVIMSGILTKPETVEVAAVAAAVAVAQEHLAQVRAAHLAYIVGTVVQVEISSIAISIRLPQVLRA